MLYSGHLSTADIFSRNQLSQATVKPLYFKPLYSGHLSVADIFSGKQWCPLLRGFTVLPLLAFLTSLKTADKDHAGTQDNCLFDDVDTE